MTDKPIIQYIKQSHYSAALKELYNVLPVLRRIIKAYCRTADNLQYPITQVLLYIKSSAMKKILIYSISMLFLSEGYAQMSNIAKPGITLIEAKLSNPQPRLNQQSSIEIASVKIIKEITRSLSTTGQIDSRYSFKDDQLRIAELKTDKIGKYTIGSMEFNLNQTNYRTPVLNYEVIDSLPNTDKGLWIRNIKVNDSIFCLIIEQRVPNDSMLTSSTITLAPLNLQFVDLAPVMFINHDFMMTQSGGSRGGEGTTLIKGRQMGFKYFYWICYFRIISKSDKIILGKEYFKNIPDYFNFQDIVIR